MKCELLAPAGSYDIAVAALNSGADAVYLATEQFGARAYAKNLTLDELEKIVNYANVLNKKIYVTCNILIKDDELDAVFKYLNKIYELGVHGVITTDFAVINYVINNLKDMECHISTQVGVKDLTDIRFFEELGAKRTVLARETNLQEIKNIKENSKMPIEVFIHGALCVSYSGNCFFSSLLTLRSGNRGRCAQNCRREYTILKDNITCAPKGYYLSMKDLNSFKNINELVNLKVDSFKIEGRMKDIDYVKTLVHTYREKIDNPNYETDVLNKIFHRNYTPGFLMNEDSGKIVSSLRAGNVGEYIGEITYFKPNLYKLKLKNKLEVNNRIRIIADKDYYFDVTELFNLNNKKVNSLEKEGYLKLDFNLKQTYPLYIIKNRNITYKDTSKIPLIIYFNTNKNDILITINYLDKYYNLTFNNYLEKAKTLGLNKQDLFKQLSKLNETPFYLSDLIVDDNIINYFLPISKINELRRNIINYIYNTYKTNRTIKNTKLELKETPNNKELIAYCHTKEQYEACLELNIKAYYKDNYLSYNETKVLNDNDILISNYGSIYLNKGKDLTLNKEFNVLNHVSLAYFLKYAKNVTLSQELSFNEIKNLITNFKNKYNFYPNVDLIIYGHMTLMTTKYCPIKHIGKCPECKTHQFSLKDDTSTFPLIHNNCITSILNGKSLNLIDEIDKLYPYINRFRLDFTIENKEETKIILNKAIKKFNNFNTPNCFNPNTDTRGYYKREII